MSAPGQAESPAPNAPEPQTPSAPETAQTPQTPSEGAQTAPAPSENFDRLFSRMDQMAQQQNEMAQRVASLFDSDEDVEDDSVYYDEYGELTEEGAQAFIKDLVSEQVQQALAPREAALAKRERDEAYEALKDEYPELAEEKVSGPVIQAALAWASQHNPGLIDRPEFVDLIEWVYKADFRQPPSPEQIEQRVELEASGGAGGRARAKPEVDWGDRIVKAAERLRPQI